VSDDRTTPVLEFAEAWLPLPDQAGMGVAIDLALGPGDLVLMQPGDASHERAIVDGACGLVAPEAGAIRFLGRAWAGLPPDQANALRGRIGLAFRRGAWLPYLTLLDNVLMPQLYHTRRRFAELCDEAALLARLFGLPGVPTGRPDEVPPADQQRAACVRAFLGAPALIVLESPSDGLVPGLLAPLINAMRAARDRDAAVLWFVQDPELFHDATIPATRRLRLRGAAMTALEATA
jgi:phospholipid/cholesterol/gamma-HCH transport system ATP-binding protein